MEIFATIIVPASNVEAAREAAAQHPMGEGMFTSALSATGTEPATHYISSGKMPEEIVQAVEGLADVSDIGPQEAMAEAGLMLCAPSD